jgi:hypothetical protein
MDKKLEQINKEIDEATRALHRELRDSYICKILAGCDSLWPGKAEDMARHRKVLTRFARSLVYQEHFTSYEPALIYFYMVSSTLALFGYILSKWMFGFHWFLLIPATLYIIFSVLRVFYILFRDHVINLQIKALREVALQDCGTDRKQLVAVANTMTVAVFTVANSIRLGEVDHGKKSS